MTKLPVLSYLCHFRRNALRGALILAGMAVLYGCAPDTAMPTTASVESPGLVSPTPSRTSTTTSTPIKIPSRTTKPTKKPTQTQTDWPTRTMLPTSLPTPTRGLPPLLTPAPREECPPPTHAKADIHFENQIPGYGEQILQYFRSYGDRADLEEQLESLGKTVMQSRIGEEEKQAVYFPNIVRITEANVDGNQSKEVIITLFQQSIMTTLGFYDSGTFIVGCRPHQFVLLGGGMVFHLTEVDPKWSGITDIQDLNANGILEIIVSGGGSAGDAQNTVFIGHAVYEWGGAVSSASCPT